MQKEFQFLFSFYLVYEENTSNLFCSKLILKQVYYEIGQKSNFTSSLLDQSSPSVGITYSC